MRIKLDHFNINQIAESGQCFRWKKLNENSVELVAFSKFLKITDEGDCFELSCSEEEWDNIWKHYFDLDTDYEEIEKLIRASSDEHMIEAYENGYGIRILKQDLWEMIISFLISQNNNITRISRSIDELCIRAGVRVEGTDNEYCFPGPFDLETDIFNDRTLGLGYRSEYLKDMFEFVRNNPKWLYELKTMSYEEARNELLKRKGIGPKVADCICLFGLHMVDAFPIDTHVRQLLEKYYSEGFDHEYYKGVRGIIQQYLFFYELKNK